MLDKRLAPLAVLCAGLIFQAHELRAAGPITVEVAEGLPEKWTWTVPMPVGQERYEVPALGLVRAPAKYNARGIEVDRKGPFLLHVTATVSVPKGAQRLMLRARGLARLVVDGEVVAETKPIKKNSSGHEAVPPENVPEDARWHPLPTSGQERIVAWTSDGGEHTFELWGMVGGKGLRNETGDLLAATIAPGGIPRLIGGDVELSDAGWSSFVAAESARLDALDARSRRLAASRDDAFWKSRHEIARRLAEAMPGKLPGGEGNVVDRRLGPEVGTPVDDAGFFRRLSLDTTGVIPDPAEVRAFLADKSSDKRTKAVAARLADPRWSDSWMGYWQDVLAENPGLLKPTLNNTGPFRRFLRNGLDDNLAIDRLVTELVRMDGSKLGGGPAGFAMATQNDAPMAAKAHVLAKAFLAVEMKCARCHDAPFHPFGQEDLFGLASMLAGKPQVIPATSTVKRQPGGRMPRVSVSIEAGESVAPEWSLTEIAPDTPIDGILPPKPSSRDRLAALITSPANTRFARVVVNRLWQRYMGVGLVEPVDDWDGDVKNHHPELLADLARELMTHDYDLKHVARLIIESKAYGARASEAESRSGLAPARRRMSAEQVLDSLFAAVGKPFRAEELCLDIDGRRPPSEFLNLGRPARAWQLALPSNERDRPALTLPVATSLTDVLITFGWRAARPDPITNREEATSPLQPALMANGVVIDARIARLSDDSAITELCLEDQPPEALIDAVTMRILSRHASESETARLVAYLGDSFKGRVVPGAKIKPPMRPSARRVSWSNHLHPEATRIQQDEERIVREGDPPTDRLTSDFRERMEDIVWALVNSPEFVFIP